MISYLFKEVERVLQLLGLRIVFWEVSRFSTDETTYILLLVVCRAPSSEILGSLDNPSPIVGRPWKFKHPKQQSPFHSCLEIRAVAVRHSNEVVLFASMVERWIVLDDVLQHCPLCAHVI